MVALVPSVSIAAVSPVSALLAAPTKAYLPSSVSEEEWAFRLAACARLIPSDEVGPGAVELGVPEFIDREMEGMCWLAGNWYMLGPIASAPPEFGYQSPLTPREVYRAGIAAVNEHCRRTFCNNSYSELAAPAQDLFLTELEKGGRIRNTLAIGDRK
jgi:gluconate 2-dehydrogenase gamma chain